MILHNIFNPDPEILITAINHFRAIAQKYFALYLVLAWGIIVASTLTLILKKKQKRYLFPLIGISLSFVSLLLLDFFAAGSPFHIAFLAYLSCSFCPSCP